MSAKNSNTTSDYVEWNVAINLIHKLYRDGDYRMSLLVGCGVFFGTRISDTLQLTWAMLLDDDRFEIIEKKTKKRREIKSTMVSKSTSKIASRLLLLPTSRNIVSLVGRKEFSAPKG